MIGSYPSPAGGEEYALTFDRGRVHRLLVLPALFDEANKLRHFTMEVMRRLDDSGIDSFLPDLPGCNESLQPMETQTLTGWGEAIRAAAAQFSATHVLAIRGGALLAPEGLSGWALAAAAGRSLLDTLLRARVLASREAGVSETREALLGSGRREGIELAGYRLGPRMLSVLDQAAVSSTLVPIPQAELGGPGLWLRAEPAHDPRQAEALARIVGHELSQ